MVQFSNVGLKTGQKNVYFMVKNVLLKTGHFGSFCCLTFSVRYLNHDLNTGPKTSKNIQNLDKRSSLCCITSHMILCSHSNCVHTVIIWITDKSGIQMVQTCPVVTWWFENWTKKWYGREYLVFKWSAWSHDQTIWKADKKCQKIQMLGFQVFSIQMVTVHKRSVFR